jgi:hypothetical protein
MKVSNYELKKSPTFEVSLLRHRRGMLLCKERLKTEKVADDWPLFTCGDSQVNQLPLAGALVSAYVVLDLRSEKHCQHGESYVGRTR